MAESNFDTMQLADWVAKIRSGDKAAHGALTRATCERMERLARKMLSRYPGLRRWVETDDVMQNAMVRLHRAIADIEVRSVRDFFGLAAEQLRRELLDLARKYQGAHRETARRDSGADLAAVAAQEDALESGRDLERWSTIHAAVERLPVEEREVFSLVFYHGWTQVSVGELLQISVRTVQRRWEAALLAIRDENKAWD